MERNAQCVGIVNIQELRQIVAMEEGLPARCEHGDPLCRYVLIRCTNMYIICELKGGGQMKSSSEDDVWGMAIKEVFCYNEGIYGRSSISRDSASIP